MFVFIDKLQAGNQVINTVAVRNTNDTYQIRSKYVLGCDGAKSQVRKWLGIESEGDDSCKTPVNGTSSMLPNSKESFEFYISTLISFILTSMPSQMKPW